MKTPHFALAAALLTLSAWPAAAGEKLRDLTVEQSTIAAAVAPNPGNLATAVASDRADATYAVGETVHLQLIANQDAYVTVLDVGPSGDATVLFPNRFQPDNHLQAGHGVEIGAAGTGGRITVSPPTGAELIKVVTSTRPITVIPEAELAGAGPYRSVVGGSKAVSRDLETVTEAPAPDAVISFANFALYTIPSRAAGGVTVIAPAPVHVAVPAEQPFPLLIATDKTSYRVGEKPAIVVSTTQACNLTVLEFNAAGVARTIFPVAAGSDSALGALQSVFVAGAPNSNFALSGPIGEEQILATCTVPAAAQPSGGISTPAAGGAVDASTVAHNLNVVAGKPGTAMASVIVSLKP